MRGAVSGTWRIITRMSEGVGDDVCYLRKAQESLETAISELTNRRFNSCANRCYYACFQAAIAALLRVGIRSTGRRNDWPHPFVQAQFIGQLVNRRHLYAVDLRTILPELQALRHGADYDPDPVTEFEATRAVRRARRFVNAGQDGPVRGGGPA